MSTERPILFSPPLVAAILEDRKHETRRIVTPQPTWLDGPCRWHWDLPASIRDRISGGFVCSASREWHEYLPLDWSPFGNPGDVLWVREAHAIETMPNARDSEVLVDRVVWRADRAARYAAKPERFTSDQFYLASDYKPERWRPSIHMPRWACRLRLLITKVGVERLQDITAEEARREGFSRAASPVRAFAAKWDELNRRRAPWSSNPWVWVLRFERLEEKAA